MVFVASTTGLRVSELLGYLLVRLQLRCGEIPLSRGIVRKHESRRGEPRFYMFDLLYWNGEDLRYFPLADRKHRLRGAVSIEAERLLYCDHIEERGKHLFRLACKRDLEGIVAKRKFDPYLLGNSKWY